MQLEDLRQDDIGTVSAWLPRLGQDANSRVQLTYPYFAHTAFYYSAQQVEHLEYSKGNIRQGTSIQMSVGMWFISIEAFINTILKISCLITGKSFLDFRTKDLGARIVGLFEILRIEKKSFYTGAFQRLGEFKIYRNELFHDRTHEKLLEFRKTCFGGNPMYANQVDVLQACVIALETYEAFRYVIADLDLMPQIMVTKDDSFFFSPLDRLYNYVLRPYFEAVLIKHSLTSSIDLNINSIPLETSSVSLPNDVRVIVKAVPDEKFNHLANDRETHIGKELFEKIRAEEIFDTANHFKTANYHRTYK